MSSYFNFWIKFFLVFASIGLTLTPLSAQNINLFSPPEHLHSDKPLVLFKGEAKGFTQLFINDRPFNIDPKTSRFYFKVPLQNPLQLHKFIIKGQTPDGKITTLTRHIMYKPSDTRSYETIPQINVFPDDQTIIPSQEMFIEGQTRLIESLTVQNQPVPIRENGTFSHKIKLQHLNDLNTLFIEAKDTFNTPIYLTRTYIYQQKSNSPTLNSLISYMDTLKNSYEKSKWEYITWTKPIKDNFIQSLEVTIGETFPNLDIHHRLFQFQNQLIFIAPYFEHKTHLTTISNVITKKIYELMGSEKTLRIMWFNDLLSFWEIAYPPGTFGIQAYEWTLNDEPINIQYPSETAIDAMAQFVQHPFQL